MLAPSGGGLILYQVYGNLYAMTVAGDGVAGIKKHHGDLSNDGIRNLATTSERGRLKEDLELSKWRRRLDHKATPSRDCKTSCEVFATLTSIGMGERRAWITFSGGRASLGSMTQNCISDLKPGAKEVKISRSKGSPKVDLYQSPLKPQLQISPPCAPSFSLAKLREVQEWLKDGEAWVLPEGFSNNHLCVIIVVYAPLGGSYLLVLLAMLIV
ncbi:hypothetical protein Tco_0544778 [Tanacetum coccineum]